MSFEVKKNILSPKDDSNTKMMIECEPVPEVKTHEIISQIEHSPKLQYLGDIEMASLKSELIESENTNALSSSGNMSKSFENMEVCDKNIENKNEDYELQITDEESSSSGVESVTTISSSDDSNKVKISNMLEKKINNANLETLIAGSLDVKPKEENLLCEDIISCEIELTGNHNEANYNNPPQECVLSKIQKVLEKDDITNTEIANHSENLQVKTSKETVESRDSFDVEKEMQKYRQPFMNCDNPFQVIVPLIGNKVIPAGDNTPFNHRYDLARERNRLRGEAEANLGHSRVAYSEQRKRRESRTPEEKLQNAKVQYYVDLRVAAYITKIAVKILQVMQQDELDEDAVKKYLNRFLVVPTTTLSLLYAPQLIHTIMYIRGSTAFSMQLRALANRCYHKYHVMFPIPEGYNFETVYTSEAKKIVPDKFDRMDDILLQYNDFDPPSDSDDSAFSEDGDQSENFCV